MKIDQRSEKKKEYCNKRYGAAREKALFQGGQARKLPRKAKKRQS